MFPHYSIQIEYSPIHWLCFEPETQPHSEAIVRFAIFVTLCFTGVNEVGGKLCLHLYIDDRSRPQHNRLTRVECPNDNIGVSIAVHIKATGQGVAKGPERLCHWEVRGHNTLGELRNDAVL